MSPEDLIARGFFLFPCEGKTPLVKWRNESTTDPAKIAFWKARFPNCSWGVDCGKSGFAVLDVDSGKVDVAEDNLADLLIRNATNFPPTFKVRTTSGGFHYYFFGEIRNSASNKLGRGLDTRGVGGYVIAPCSSGYTCILDLPIAPLPQWLAAIVGKPTEAEAPAPDPNFTYDTPSAITLATEYLKLAKPALMGEGGNETLFRTAAHVKDFGVSFDTAVQLMLEHYYPRCQPSDRVESLVRITTNAYNYGSLPPGVADPKSVFTPFIDTPETGYRRFKPYKRDDIMNLPMINWLVKGLIPDSGVFQIYGPSKAGKSFLMFGMLAAIAEGSPWFGLRTVKTPVNYISLEGWGGVKQRMIAWERQHKRPFPPDFNIFLYPWSIVTKKDVLDMAHDICIDAPSRSVTLIDTQNRAAPAINESASEGMGAILQGAQLLQLETKGVVGLVAHVGKDASRGSRGHSSQLPFMDAAIEVTRIGDIGTWKAIKVKDGADGYEKDFMLKTVGIGLYNADGEEYTSCVIEEELDTTVDVRGYNLKPNEADAFISAKMVASETTTGEFTKVAWIQQLAAQTRSPLSTAKERGNISKRIDTAMVNLKKYGLVSEENGLYRISALTSVDTQD